MPQNGLPDEMSSLVINSGEKIWINLYPNALCNVKKSLKGHLDERIGKFCDKYVLDYYTLFLEQAFLKPQNVVYLA